MEDNDFFLATKEITADDKKQLSNLYVRPEYKALVKLWDQSIMYLQRNVLTEGATMEDIKVFHWVIKIQNILKSTVLTYHKNYADPNKWKKATDPESIVQDLQALKTISEAYGQG